MKIKAEFNRSSRPEDKKLARLIDAIVAERPDLADSSFLVPAQGNSAYTLVVGDEVFKAPKRSLDIPVIAREFRLQESFTKAGVAGVAAVTYAGKKSCFYAVKKMGGVHPDFWHMTPAEREACWSSVGRMIASAGKADRPRIRRGRSDKLVAAGVRMWRKAAGFSDAWQQKAPALAAAIDDYARRFTKRKYVLAHGDLHIGNILIDADAKTATGIIDWGSAYHTLVPELGFRDLGFQVGEHMPQHHPSDALAAFTGFCAQQCDALYKPDDIVIARVVKYMGLYKLDTRKDLDWWIDNAGKDVADDLEHLGIALNPSAVTPRRRVGNTLK